MKVVHMTDGLSGLTTECSYTWDGYSGVAGVCFSEVYGDEGLTFMIPL